MLRIDTTPEAHGDARSIWRYIAQDDVDAATDTLHRIEDRLASLASLAAMPLSAEAVPTLAANVRRSSVGNYVIYYRPIEDGIHVLRILHGARQPEDLL